MKFNTIYFLNCGNFCHLAAGKNRLNKTTVSKCSEIYRKIPNISPPEYKPP